MLGQRCWDKDAGTKKVIETTIELPLWLVFVLTAAFALPAFFFLPAANRWIERDD